MKIEILYFDGCPAYRTAAKNLRAVLAEEGTEATVELVAVNTDDDAGRLHFPGSPTLRVDGEDLFPIQDRDVWALSCRTYLTPEGLKAWPTQEMLRTALAPKGAGHAGGMSKSP